MCTGDSSIATRSEKQSLVCVATSWSSRSGLFALLQATQFESVLKASLYAYTIYGAAVTPVGAGGIFLEARHHGGRDHVDRLWAPS